MSEPLTKDQLRRQRKSQAFFAKQDERRKAPGNCGRCGKPNADKTRKVCARCRELNSACYRRRAEKLSVNETIRALAKRVASLELSVARLQLNDRALTSRYHYQQAVKREAKRYLSAYPTITKQELSTMNHAYEATQ